MDDEEDSRERMATQHARPQTGPALVQLRGTGASIKDREGSRRTLYEHDVQQRQNATGVNVSVVDGVKTVEFTLDNGEEVGVDTAPRELVRGIVITKVIPGSGAARAAAFSVGDVLLSINGRGVLNASHEAVQLALEVSQRTSSLRPDLFKSTLQNPFVSSRCRSYVLLSSPHSTAVRRLGRYATAKSALRCSR
jgi:hypothetical protein